MSLLQVCDVRKTYQVRSGLFAPKTAVHALRGVSFELEVGKCLGLVGESGCGKSTLARLICGLETPDRGVVRFAGQPIAQRGPGVRTWRRAIQFVWQDSVDAVNPRWSAARILEEPLGNFFGLRGRALARRQAELMEIVGLLPRELSKRPGEFSGGQLQRICIARALAAEPTLLIMDEPLSSLDVSVQAQVLNLLREIKEDTGISLLLISHDIEAVYYLSDSLAVMYGGAFVETLDDITDYHSLIHPYTRRLFASPVDEFTDPQELSMKVLARHHGEPTQKVDEASLTVMDHLAPGHQIASPALDRVLFAGQTPTGWR